MKIFYLKEGRGLKLSGSIWAAVKYFHYFLLKTKTFQPNFTWQSPIIDLPVSPPHMSEPGDKHCSMEHTPGYDINHEDSISEPDISHLNNNPISDDLDNTDMSLKSFDQSLH